MSNEITIQVEWGDTDPAAIVFFPNIFKWFDMGTRHLFDSIGLTYEVLRGEYGLIGIPLVETTSKFHYPIRFGDTVHLRSFFVSLNRKTLQIAHHARVGRKQCAEGMETRVLGKRSGSDSRMIKATVIPDEIKQMLREHIELPESGGQGIPI